MNFQDESSINSKNLVDNFGRKLDYLRISVTERCNLRCTYCMPEEGIPHLEHNQILTFEEIIYLAKIFSEYGVQKFRFTGGEPFVRKDFISLLKMFRAELPTASLHLTSNGVLLHKYLIDLADIGLEGINLSLDSVNPEKFATITRRNNFNDVKKSLDKLLELNFNLKLNMVVQPDFNTDEIISLARFAIENNIEVRFIEQMKFNGIGTVSESWDGDRILKELKQNFENLSPILKDGTTAVNYSTPNMLGSLGIINGHSRTFCNTCNRIRLTADGTLKTCLYDNGVLNLRDMLRTGEQEKIAVAIERASQLRNKDGFETEAKNRNMNESMAAIGG